MPHFVPATWRNRAAASMSADFPSGNAPTALVLRRTSRRMRFQRVVRPQTAPVLSRKRVVEQRLLDPRRYQRGCICQFHLFEFYSDLFRILPCSRAVFLRVNGFHIAATSFTLLVGTAVHTLR